MEHGRELGTYDVGEHKLGGGEAVLEEDREAVEKEDDHAELHGEQHVSDSADSQGG